MSRDYDTPEFREKLVRISKYWRKYFDQLEKWIEEDRGGPPEPLDPNLSQRELWRVVGARHNLAKSQAIKKHISSTHTWIPGKMHWSKKWTIGTKLLLNVKFVVWELLDMKS